MESALRGAKIQILVSPESTNPDNAWLEPSDNKYFTILSIRDVYKHPVRGRCLEFFTEDHAVRNVAISQIVLHKETAIHLNKLLEMA